MEYPKITLITPSFNQGQFLEETIISVLDQAYPNLEYMVIDGGSTDSSVEVIKKYEGKLSCWVSEKDDGQSHAINKGLERSSGQIFNWLNSDDKLLPGALHRVAEIFQQHPGTEAVLGYEKEFFMEEPSREEYFRTWVETSLEETIYTGRIIQSPSYFSMEAVRRIGPLRKELHYLMDAEWWIRYLLTTGMKKVFLTNEIFTLFRIHPSSKTGSKGQHFGHERKMLNRSLALAAGIPESKVNRMIGEIPEYLPLFEKLKLSDEIDFDKLKSLFDRDYYYQHYILSDFHEARKSFKNYLRYEKPNWNTSLFIRAVKILIMPAWLVTAGRKIMKMLFKGNH